MAEAGIILASVGLFLQIFDVCDHLYHAFKLTRRFGEDFEIVQIELEVQWARFNALLTKRPVSREYIDPGDQNNVNTSTVLRCVSLMQRYFKTCNDLMGWYDGNTNESPFVHSNDNSERERHTSKASLTNTLASTQNQPLHSSSAESKKFRKLLYSAFSKIKTSSSKRSSPVSSSTPAIAHTSDTNSTVGTLASETLKTETLETETTEAIDLESKAHQEAVKAYKLIPWARRDLDTLRETIRHIRDNNNDLEKLVKLISLKDPAKSLPTVEGIEKFWPVVSQVEEALRILHQDLMDINTEGESGYPYFLSIQLLENHDRSRSDLRKRQGAQRHMHEGSRVFNLQRHNSEQFDDESQLLLIENVKKRVQNLASLRWKLNTLHELQSLKRPEDLVVASFADVEEWGYFPASSEADFVNKIYHTTRDQWSSTCSLQDVLKENDYRRRMLPPQMVQLARLILSAHLYLESVQKDCISLRPEHYRFYQTVDEERGWNEDRPLVLRPWLAFGFGRRPAETKLGASTGVVESPNSRMNELGLLLFQIGAGQIIEYGKGFQGLRDAKLDALAKLYVLDTRVGLIYSELVQGFLEFQAPAAHLLAPDDENQEIEYVKKAVSALYKLEQLLENTQAIPLQA